MATNVTNESTYILRIDLDGKQELVIIYLLLDTFNDFEQDASPVLKASSVSVGSLVHVWRNELTEQVAVGAVELDTAGDQQRYTNTIS